MTERPTLDRPDEAAITRLLGVNGHQTSAYGQGSYDGDFCRQCGWQGPPRSGRDHEAETRRVAFREVLAAHDAETRAQTCDDLAEHWPEDMTRGEAQQWLATVATRERDGAA